MSTTASAPLIKAVKGALVARIAALPEYANRTPSPVPVSWGHPMGKLEKTHAWLGDWRSTQAWKSIGDRQREINAGTFDLVIWAEGEGDTSLEVETIAFDLLEPVEVYLRANVTAGLDLGDFPGCKHFRLAVGSFDMSGGAEGKSRAALISCDIDLYARI